jgi:hypothetical protein
MDEEVDILLIFSRALAYFGIFSLFFGFTIILFLHPTIAFNISIISTLIYQSFHAIEDDE